MLSTRWRKVLIDLWTNRARTLIVALAVAVGVYSVGVVLHSQEILTREYARDGQDAYMASAIVRTLPFGEDLADRVAEIPGVAAAEGRSTIQVFALDETGKRRQVLLTSIPDFNSMEVDAIIPLEGDWPPEKRDVILERQALEYLDVEEGQALVIELEDGTEKSLSIVGVAHDAQRMSPDVTSTATGYVTRETMGALGGSDMYTELRIRVDEHADDEAYILGVVDEVEEVLERTGRPVLTRRIITERYADPFIETIVLILSSFGLIILVLSGFLVINAITALITRQIPQIGVMKLVGARRGQIMSLYIATVLVYGLLAIALGIPASILTARLIMTELVEWLLNVQPESYAVPWHLIAIQAGVGLLLPLVAGLVPVLKGTRITTNKALSDVGMATGATGQGWVEGLLGLIQRVTTLQRPNLLAIRNALRHKGRLAQTLIVLVVGTALFISVISLWTSVDATVDDFMRFHRYDVSLSLDRPYRVARLEQAAMSVPGVVASEGWSVDGATRQRPDGTESDGMQLYGLPEGTQFMAAQVSDGRWLSGSERNAVVVNSDVVDKEPDIGVGSEIELSIGGRDADYTVVGIVPTEAAGPAIYMDLDDYAYITRTTGQANRLKVVTEQHDMAFQERMEEELYAQLEARGFGVRSTSTTQVMAEENKLMFVIIVAVLALMALLLAAVGGLGLTTTMSINIMERVREIGVLRAIGATNLSVRRIVLAEGIIIGLVSWVVGALLSWPISLFMSDQLGLALIKVPLTFQYSWQAAIIWFFVLQAVAVVASLGPARNAVRLTIREVLAYE